MSIVNNKNKKFAIIQKKNYQKNQQIKTFTAKSNDLQFKNHSISYSFVEQQH